MSRRDRSRFTKRWSLALAGASLLALSAAGASRPPNIVFILADDLGYGDIGPFGQEKIRTPNLDAMAAEGTCFTQFYPGAAVCAPTRCCLMTGRHTGHGRVRGNHGRAGLSRVPLQPEDITVAELLREAGYATAVIGKWGLGEPGTTGVPNRQGFDFFYGYLNQDHAEDYYPEKLWRNETEEALPENAGGARGAYSHDRFTAEALRFIEANRSRPFFLYLAYTIPHLIWEVPEDSLREYEGAFEEVPVDPPSARIPTDKPRATYAAMVSRLDRDVGRVLARIDELGLGTDTIVFFASDNGATPHAGVSAFFQSNGPLRGHKGTFYEGGIRTSMIVRWPGQVPAGRRSDFVWAGWDFLPTAAELAGVSPPADIDGVSVVAALRGRPVARTRTLYWEALEKRGFQQALREGDLKAVRTDLDQPIQVFDLRTDPAETRDVAAQHPAFVARARELFRSARTPNEHWPVPLLDASR